MAWTQGDLDALDAAISSNVRKVTFADGRSREFHSPADMLAVRKEMKAELVAASSSITNRRRTTIGRMVRGR